jgi:hypothetical protein
MPLDQTAAIFSINLGLIVPFHIGLIADRFLPREIGIHI